MSSNNKAVARKIRSEYMKKFRDPKWDTFSKNYEDSVKYRVTRRVMEQTHKPLFWDGWDSGSDSSGRSSPKLRESLEPVLAKLQTPLESRSENEEAQEVVEPAVNGQSTAPLSMENSSGVGKSASIAYSPIIIISPISLLLNIICSGLTGDNACQLFLIYLLSVHDDVHVVFLAENGLPDETDNQNTSSETAPRRRPRRRAPRSEPGYDGDTDQSRPSSAPKPSRAKSQPPEREKRSEREHRRSYMRPGWAERHVETRGRTPSMRASVSAGEVSNDQCCESTC